MPLDVPSPLNLTGGISGVTLVDPDGNPNLVVDVDLGFSITVSWSLAGSGLPYLGGQFRVRALVESIGAGFEGQIQTAVVPVNPSGSYSTTLVIPPGSAPMTPNVVYKLVVLVSHENFGLQTELAGFADGPYFEVRKP